MNILMAINDNYVEHALVLIYSIIKNNQEEEFCFYFICNDMCKQSKKRIASIIKKNDKTVKFLNISKGMFANAPERENISIETYFRLLAFKLLPNVDKILYLDADILVTNSLKELYMTDVTNVCIAGVADQGEVQNDKYHKARIGLSVNATYINGGVLLMNLDRMRSYISIDDIFKFIQQMGRKLVYQDQDVVNVVFQDEIKILPLEYNKAPLYNDEKDFVQYLKDVLWRDKSFPTIIHYMGVKSKPWRGVLYGYKYHTIYYEYCKAAHCKNLQWLTGRSLMLRPIALLKQWNIEKYEH